MKWFFRSFLVLVALLLGVLAWDVWQIRGLRPPDDSTFEGFIRSGRTGSLLLDEDGKRIYLVSPPAKTIVRSAEPPVYEFDGRGMLLNWTPGTQNQKGMMIDVPICPQGRPSNVENARTWIRSRK